MADEAPPSLPKEGSNRGDPKTDQKRSNITGTVTPKYKADQADAGKSTGDQLGDATGDKAPR